VGDEDDRSVMLCLRFTLSFDSVKEHLRLVGDIGDGLAECGARVIAIREDPRIETRIFKSQRHRIAKPKLPVISGPSVTPVAS
jgi:hypothetical protein